MALRMAKKNSIITAISAVLLLSDGVCFAWDDEGVQWWPTTGIFHQINKDWQFNFEQEERLGDDGGNMYYEHSDFGFVCSGLADWIDLGFNYRLIYQKDGKDHFKYENRPHFNITFKGKLFGWDVSDRSRIEYRDMETTKDTWRYRNKIAVVFPIELTDLKLQPYIANDAFINLNPGDFTMNWLYTGFTFRLTENIRTDIYHMWQASKTRTEWKNVFVLGTKLTFTF